MTSFGSLDRRDNRDPALLGRALLDRRRRAKKSPLHRLADSTDLSQIPHYEQAREPGEPMCGYPLGGPRTLATKNGKAPDEVA